MTIEPMLPAASDGCSPSPSPSSQEEPIFDAEHPKFRMVLVVEDDAIVQRIVQRTVLRAIGPDHIHMHVVDDALDAIAALRTVKFDLIISDYNLRGSHGGEILAWIRTHQPEMAERFVFWSGADEPAHLHHQVIRKDSPTATAEAIQLIRRVAA